VLKTYVTKKKFNFKDFIPNKQPNKQQKQMTTTTTTVNKKCETKNINDNSKKTNKNNKNYFHRCQICQLEINIFFFCSC